MFTFLFLNGGNMLLDDRENQKVQLDLFKEIKDKQKTDCGILINCHELHTCIIYYHECHLHISFIIDKTCIVMSSLNWLNE